MKTLEYYLFIFWFSALIVDLMEPGIGVESYPFIFLTVVLGILVWCEEAVKWFKSKHQNRSSE